MAVSWRLDTTGKSTYRTKLEVRDGSTIRKSGSLEDEGKASMIRGFFCGGSSENSQAGCENRVWCGNMGVGSNLSRPKNTRGTESSNRLDIWAFLLHLQELGCTRIPFFSTFVCNGLNDHLRGLFRVLCLIFPFAFVLFPACLL